ncbi:MAG: GntR family transcriptional regulator [Ruminococcaceae bacterium]|nr:GntR family transcriptional regulator [Oscillospiraceae bacterium]
MQETSLKTISTVDAVYNALTKDILSMAFPPGAKITETTLCERYGISRNTLREGVSLLLAHGLLVKVPNKGIFVRSLELEDVQEIFRLRELLELEAVRCIIDSENIPIELVQMVELLESNCADGDWESYLEADIQFHSALVKSANSPRLQRLYDAIFAEVKLCIYQSRFVANFDPESAAQHRRLLSAMETGDLQAAQSVLTAHIASALNTYQAAFKTR